MFSWKSALTSEIRSRETVYATEEIRRKISVATTSGGMTASATSASVTSVATSATVIPRTVRTLTTAVDIPVWMNDDNASTSVVIRVMMRPDSSRS